MDEKRFQLFARAKAFIYENAPAKYGISWEATFVLDDEDGEAASSAAQPVPPEAELAAH